MKNLILLLVTVFHMAHADIKIVATPTCEIEDVSKSDIKKLFLLKQKSIDKKPIMVVDRRENVIYKQFIKQHLNKSLRQVKTYWVRMLFTGREIAPQKLSLEELNALDYQESCYFSYIEEKEIIDAIQWKSVKIQEKVNHEICATF